MISTEFDFIEECVLDTCDLAADHGFVRNSWLLIVVLLNFISHDKSVSHRRIIQWWNEKNVISWRTMQRQTQQTVYVSQKTGMNRILSCCEFFKANNTVALNMIEMVIVLLQAYIPTWLRPVGLASGVKSVKVLTVVLKTNWPRGDYNYRIIVVHADRRQ